MGSFFDQPSPSITAPPIEQDDDDSEHARREALARRRRGRAGLIVTSAQGLLEEGAKNSGKTLLGD